MSFLDRDRLPAEESAPTAGPATPADPAVRPSSAGTATPDEEPTTTVLTQRTGEARATGTIRGGTHAVAKALRGRRARTAPSGGRHRRPMAPALRRRPMAYLAASVVGAAGLGLVTAGDRVAQGDRLGSAGDSVSVARELGLDNQSQATAVAPDDAARLEEMTASRTAREAVEAAAAHAQAEADRLAVAAAARPTAVLPVAGARLTSGFGARWGTQHAGIDLAAPMHTPEHAVMDGVVLEAGPASGFGLAVYIQHENGDVTVYGHMDQILVQPGQVVRAGDTIALLGNRGQSTGPHLHFEVHVGGVGGQKVDPLPWLRERGVAI